MISQTYFATVPFMISRKVFIGYKQKLIDNIFGFQYQRARRGCDVVPTLDQKCMVIIDNSLSLLGLAETAYGASVLTLIAITVLVIRTLCKCMCKLSKRSHKNRKWLTSSWG